MKDLRNIWECGFFIADQSGDGVPDQINVSIDWEATTVLPIGLIDFCGKLGFETTALSFDFFNNREKAYHVSFCQSDQTGCRLHTESKGIMINYESIEQLNYLLKFLAANWPHCLVSDERVVGFSVTNKQEINVELANSDQIKVIVDQVTCNINSGKTISSLTELWDGTGFLQGVEASPHNELNVSFSIDLDINWQTFKEICYGAARIGMSATTLTFPLTEKGKSDVSFDFRSNDVSKTSISLVNQGTVVIEGSGKAFEHAVSYLLSTKHWTEGGKFASWERGLTPQDDKEEKLLFELDWHDKGEVNDLWKNVDQLSRASYNIDEVEVYLSEPQQIRANIKSEIQKLFPSCNVRVRSTFKPAIYWAKEELIPKLENLSDTITNIDIYCKKENHEDGLELPIRWIQELYPIDELLAKQLSIEKEKIIFHLEENQESTFKFIVSGQKGKLLLEELLDVPITQLNYLQEGIFVYPTTSGIRLKKDSKTIHEVLIPTDRERFYRYYQENVLNKLWNMVDRSDPSSGFTQPLFDRLEILVEMSEEEEKLYIEEERVSALEALHEDLYFNTLDFFLEKGKEEIGKGYTAPGGVYPFMKTKQGVKPSATIRAYGWKSIKQREYETTKLIFSPEQSTPVYIEYNEKGSSELKRYYPKPSDVQIQINEGIPKPLNATVHTWIPAHSYRGEWIPVYEVFHSVQADYFSPLKITAYKPTLLIETGHHANEISSMPAVVELIDEIQERNPNLLNNINLVIIPRANPDGTKLHEQMTADNPEWKHHAARYNAVGLEYAHVRYQKTVFGEADVVPSIMRRWAPDVIIDDHGIPSHEWIQPFAGFNSPPRFPVSYWMPNALIYGIARELDKEQYPQHNQILSEIIESIQLKIKGTIIHEKNKEWLARYKKYGHKWLPDIFPIEQKEDLIFYLWETKKDKSSTAALARYPEWVSADIISEAADETVYGKSLELCKEAHKRFNLAIIETIAKKQMIERKRDNNIHLINRIRPLSLESGDELNAQTTINRL